jgi:hypothetical protein
MAFGFGGGHIRLSSVLVAKVYFEKSGRANRDSSLGIKLEADGRLLSADTVTVWEVT